MIAIEFPGEPRALATGAFAVGARGVLRALTLEKLRALTLTARPGIARLVLILIIAAACGQCAAGPVTTFDDIRFWVGTGANRSALAIDWNGPDTSDHSLVWGYRWDGAATGIDMLTAIIRADDRLYAKMGPIGGFGFGVVGLGYDTNNDGLFALDDGTTFDQSGINDEVPSDFAESVDPDDWYAEGWLFENFWNYGIASSSPFDGGAWGRSGGGVSSRNLTDGSWDSLAYSPVGALHFAQNPLAAQAAGSGDFNGDGRIDGRDFLAWQRGESPAPWSAADLAAWQAGYVSGGPAASNTVIPEPSTGLLVFFAVLLTWFFHPRRRMTHEMVL